MLVAKEKVEYYSLPAEQPKPIKKKAKAFKFNKRLKVACSLLVLLSFLLGLFFTSKYAQLSAAGQELMKKQRALAAVQLETEMLEKEISRLQSLDRIESIATSKLGMHLPEGEGIYFLAIESDSKKKVEEKEYLENRESIKKTEKTDTAEEKSVLSVLSDLWFNWLTTIEEAEAETVY